MKSVIFATNASPTPVLAGGALPLGTIIRRYGCALDLNGNGINAYEPGYYKVTASISATPTDAGIVTATLLSDGVPISGATASATAAAGETVALPIVAVIRRFCPASSALTITLNVAGTLENLAVAVEKE